MHFYDLASMLTRQQQDFISLDGKDVANKKVAFMDEIIDSKEFTSKEIPLIRLHLDAQFANLQVGGLRRRVI